MSHNRCEVCTARLDPDRAAGPRRCVEHVAQIALFGPPPADLPRPRRSGSRPTTSDTSGDRHPVRARRTRTTEKG